MMELGLTKNKRVAKLGLHNPAVLYKHAQNTRVTLLTDRYRNHDLRIDFLESLDTPRQPRAVDLGLSRSYLPAIVGVLQRPR